MVSVWVYVVGGIIIGILVLVIGFNLIHSTIIFYQKQSALSQFSSFYTDVKTVCLQEVNNSMIQKYQFPFQVRVVYSTDDKTSLPKVFDLIKNQELSHGYNLCLQFKDEQKLRCEEILCNTTIPYLGVLPETEDIWIMVSKILGRAPIKEYELLIKKISDEKVNITIR